jgi:GNAT superfamily N-acetyltransferase
MNASEIELAAARHWQAPEEGYLGEWLLRAGAGFTGRANSALPLGDPGVELAGAACAQARRLGAGRMFLQVEKGNTAARALYARIGFRDSHEYHYRVAPA